MKEMRLIFGYLEETLNKAKKPGVGYLLNLILNFGHPKKSNVSNQNVLLPKKNLSLQMSNYPGKVWNGNIKFSPLQSIGKLHRNYN